MLIEHCSSGRAQLVKIIARWLVAGLSHWQLTPEYFPKACLKANCGQVVEILSDALQIPETAPPVKIARLMVVSDLLHNTGKPPHKLS